MSTKVDYKTNNKHHLLEDLSNESKTQEILLIEKAKKPNHIVLTDKQPTGLRGLFATIGNIFTRSSAKLNHLEKIAKLTQKRVDREFNKYLSDMKEPLNHEAIIKNLQKRKFQLIKEVKTIAKENPKNKQVKTQKQDSITKIQRSFDKAIFRAQLEHLNFLRTNTPSSLEALANSGGMLSGLFGSNNKLNILAKDLNEINEILELVKADPILYKELKNEQEILNLFLSVRGDSSKLHSHANILQLHMQANRFTVPTAATIDNEISSVIKAVPAQQNKTEHLELLQQLKNVYEAIEIADNYDREKALKTRARLFDKVSPELAARLSRSNQLKTTENISIFRRGINGAIRYALLRGGPKLLTENGRQTLHNAVTYVAPIAGSILPFIQENPYAAVAIEVGIFAISTYPSIVTTPLSAIDNKLTGGFIRRKMIPGFLKDLARS